MRLLRKILVNLTVVALLLILIYCLLTSNGRTNWSEHYFGSQNVTGKAPNISTALDRARTVNAGVLSYRAKKIKNEETESNRAIDYYNVWCIFTKVTTNSPMKRKFRIFTDSLLRLASVDVAFHVITDNESRVIAESVVGGVLNATGKSMEVR